VTYNGWSNYETWNVALWLDNDEGTYHEMRDRMHGAVKAASRFLSGDDARDKALALLADEIKDYVRNGEPDLGASMFADLLGAALSEVDWYEIAAHYLSDWEEETADA
jgi:hypothetical protein